MATKENEPGVLSAVKEYWVAYGSLPSLIRSGYFRISILLMPFLYGMWSKPLWWDTVISILPNVLGVSLAAFTLFLSAGNERFREAISGQKTFELDDIGKPLPSPFFKTATIFLHFILFQLLAVLLALVCKSLYALEPLDFFAKYNEWAQLFVWFFCFLVFVYSICVIAAAGFGVYEVVRWFDEFVNEERE